MEAVLNHIAYLVDSIEFVLKENSFPIHQIGKLEKFPSEGTTELYIGKQYQLGKLLLMQATGSGPYQNALKKRGAGLHHIALDVENIEDYMNQISGSGWKLHPKSLKYYKQQQTVFLCRKNEPVIIEIQERNPTINQDYFINRILFPFSDKKLMHSLNCPQISIGKSIELLTKSSNDPINFIF